MSASSNDLFAGGGEMGALMRSTDWPKTRLGPVERWPGSLKTMLGVVLGSRFPMLLWWGPDLLHLYNDAYRPILRDKHPASLAAPAAEVWAEVWDVAGPMARSVLEGGPATWTEDLQLFINSGPMAEETYFTFSYSPVPGEDGGVGGILNTVQESTAKVQGEREIRMLHGMAARAAEAGSEDEACRIVAEVLSGNELDVPFALLYRVNDAAGEAQLVGVSGWETYHGRARAERISLNGSANADWPLHDVVRTARELIVDELAARFGPLPAGRWNARPERALVLPLVRAGVSTPYALLVAGLSPHRAFDERYRRFFRATADQVTTVIANARAFEAEKKRAEALAEVDRAKTAFFNNVSHEFRTPLTLILGPVEDALARAKGSLEGEELAAVHRSARRLMRLVNNLLEFARLEAGRLQSWFAPTDLATLTAGLASSFRSLVEGSSLSLVVDCPPLSEAVYIDVAQWERIVLNLVSNAFKFTLQGEIAVRLRDCGGHVELTVRDTGCGIPERELPRVFERFHRVEGVRGRSFEGTGIGLSLVHEYAKIHGGGVRVSSVEGQGSTFVVTIPKGLSHLPAERIAGRRDLDDLATDGEPYLLEAMSWTEDAGSVTAEAPQTRADAPGPTNGAGTDGARRARVLVADDNADMRRYLGRILGTRWIVETASDGRLALEAARERPPDLVLSDVMMPRLDGLALLRELRADQRTREVPVVLLSARAGEESLLSGIETGADDYLVKPFSARELLARVQTHLDMGRLRRQWASELEAANKELDSFAHSVSHDLRAPLRAVVGFASIVARDHGPQLPEKGQEYLREVVAAAKRMDQLIDDLLRFARVGQQSLERRSVDVADLVREVLEELRDNYAGRDVEIIVGALPPAVADRALLKQVLANLLSNAFKFTSRTKNAVVEVGSRAENSSTIYFVRDNGAGFDMRYAARLFGVFQRMHRSDEFEGTGVGLSLAHRIIQRHGGRLSAEAEMGKGATFQFSLTT